MILSICLDSYQQMFRVMQRRNTSVSQAEQTLLHYIDEHLADINLTMLADVTGMNQNYLSQYLKKHYGVTFLDYITRKKIEKAKKLEAPLPMNIGRCIENNSFESN